MPAPTYLSKTRYVSGLQCPRKLWWEVHDREAPELLVDESTQAVFDRGHRVGAAAQAFVPGGVLIDEPYDQFQARIDATRAAIDAGATAIYEAAFMADGVFVSVDILERVPGGFVLVEVKSTLGVKAQHLPDVAIQLHVLRRASIEVIRAEVMHLDRDCRHPDLSNLFVRTDVTADAEELAATIPSRVTALLAALAGTEPVVATGAHCSSPYPCVFKARCWPATPEHHVSSLYRVHPSRVAALVADGYHTVADIPADFEASGPVSRQIEAVRTGTMVVEPTLADALATITGPIAFVDFETVSPAIPVWPGCSPYTQVPVQFSCHVIDSEGLSHHAWLAEGLADPREAIATALVAACAGATTVLAYNAPFEQKCIAHLAEAVPALADELASLSACIVDLLPIVRDHVYHPDFGGSFGLKAVLPALVTDLHYDDLEIAEGMAASAALEDLLLRSESVAAVARAALRSNLLAYCERDTLAMVRLYDRLRDLAAGG